MGEERNGGGIQPLSHEGLLGMGKQGRASVTGSPDSGGIHSLIGVLPPRCPFGTFLIGQKAC